MRLSLAVFGMVAALIGASDALAQQREEFLRCRAVADGERRLACYDALRLSTASPRSKYEAVPLQELQTYALSFRSRLVEVSGWITPGDAFFALRHDAEASESLPVDISALSRDQQRSVREQCGSGCAAAIEGRVGPVNFTTGIVAERVMMR